MNIKSELKDLEKFRILTKFNSRQRTSENF